MIIRVRHKEGGLSDYLLSGKKKSSKYTRNEKDEVIPIYGDLNFFKTTEEYVRKYKNYKSNYLHITVGFSKNDNDKLAQIDESGKGYKIAILEQITKDILNHYANGYDLDKEIIAYAEFHAPKIQQEYNEKGILTERLGHLHIAFILWNPETDKRVIQSLFNPTIDSVFQNQMNEKYGMDKPQENKRIGREREYKSFVALKRNELKDKNWKNRDEMLKYFKSMGYIENVDYKHIKTHKNNYYKLFLIDKNGKKHSINLQGRGFESVDENPRKIMENREILQNEQELLEKFYEKRKEKIEKSKEPRKYTRKVKPAILDNNPPPKLINSIFKGERRKYPKIYKSDIYQQLKPYIKGFEGGFVYFYKDLGANRGNIDVVDKGNVIESHGNNMTEEVALMLKIAQAKGWQLNALKITGSDEFKNEVYKQVREIERAHYIFKKSPKQEITRKTTPFQSIQAELEDNDTKKEHKYNIDYLNKTLNADILLNYAEKHYNINRSNYEVTDDGRINNKTNRQKPKSIVDFYNKELNLPLKEALNICDNLLNNESKELSKDTLKAEIKSARTTTTQTTQNRALTDFVEKIIEDELKSNVAKTPQNREIAEHKAKNKTELDSKTTQNRDFADTKAAASIAPKSAKITQSVETTPKIEQSKYKTLSLKAEIQANNETGQTLSFEINENKGFSISKTAKMPKNTAQKYKESLIKMGIYAELYQNPKAERADFSFGIIFAKTSEALALAIEYMKSKLGLSNKEPEIQKSQELTQKPKENEILNPNQTQEIKTLNNKPKINEKSKNKQNDSYGMSM